jgi:hypothetical protein
MPNNLSAYSFVNDANLCNTGVCFDIDEAALTSGVLYPQTGQVRDGGYSPPPVSITYTPVEVDGEDSMILDSYLSEGSTVSVNLSSTTTCMNLATGYDAFNFGYQLLIQNRGIVLDRTDNFTYENDTFSITGSGSLISNWIVLSSTARYNKMLSGASIDLLPIGSYKRTTFPNDIITLNYYLPIEYEIPPVFWPDEMLNVYKTKKIVWDMSSIRLGGEDLKNTFIPISRNETIFVVDQARPIPLDCDYIVARYEFLSSNGRDLDIFASIISNDTRQYPVSSPVGYCTNSPTENQDFIKWGGDNTLYGVEAVLFNVKNYTNYYDEYNHLLARFAARWYPSGAMDGDRYAALKLTCYSGGTMTLSSDENFYNIGGSKIAEIILPAQYIDTKGGCGAYETIDGVQYTTLVKSNIGVMEYNKSNSTLSFTALTGKVGASYVSYGTYNIGPDIEIPLTPTYSTSAVQEATLFKSTLLWSDGVVTESMFTYPLYLPDGTYGSEGGVIHSRKFSTPGSYTILTNTFNYTDMTGELQSIVEPYNITFVVS